MPFMGTGLPGFVEAILFFVLFVAVGAVGAPPMMLPSWAWGRREELERDILQQAKSRAKWRLPRRRSKRASAARRSCRRTITTDKEVRRRRQMHLFAPHRQRLALAEPID